VQFFKSQDGNAAAENAVLLGMFAAGLFAGTLTLQSALGAGLSNSVEHIP
jgi:Flp pilus assembly pilin Flp